MLRDRLAGPARTSSRRCRWSSSRRAGSSRACCARTATGTTCSGASRSPTRRSAAPRRPARACGRSPGEAQRELREFDEENYVERPRPLSLGQVQALPVPGHVGDRRRRARAAARRRPHRGRDGVWGPVGGRRGLRRLPVAGRDPVAVGDRQPRRVPRDARAPAARGSRRRRGSSPATARRSTRSGRSRSCARTSPTSRRCPTRPRRCRWRAGPRAAQDPRGEPQAGERHEPPAHAPRDPPRGRGRRDRLLGAARLRPRRAPEGLRGRAAWVARNGTHIHLLYDDEPTVAPRGHVAILADDYDATVARVRDAGFDFEPGRRSSGARRAASCARRPGTGSRSWPGRRRHRIRPWRGSASA